MEKTNIILIGSAGVGKTTIGKTLADRQKKLFYDSDELFESRFGKISEFFERYGEAMFRVEEGEILYELSRKENAVIALGGGAVLSPAMSYIRERGIVVLLNAETETIAARLQGDTTRPLLRGGDLKSRIETQKRERAPLYKKYADIVLAADGKTADETASEIIAAVKQSR